MDWGCHWTGGIVSRANPTYTAEELKYQIIDSGAKAIVVHISGIGVLSLFDLVLSLSLSPSSPAIRSQSTITLLVHSRNVQYLKSLLKIVILYIINQQICQYGVPKSN